MDLEAAKNLPSNILFGTSSWTYEGWKGLIYKKCYKNEKNFRSECLKEYVDFPWFRTVGIDSSFYGPPHPKTLDRYASQVPDDFRWVSKVWEEITIPKYSKHKRYGDKAGQKNPNFLNADYFIDLFLQRFEAVKKHTGPFVFQFQTLSGDFGKQPEMFIEKLDSFLAQLPTDFQYATEVRNSNFLIPKYFEALNKRGATHCFNHWTRMPRLLDQMKAAASAGGLNAPFFVARILTPLGVSYEEAVRRFSPYDSLKAENPDMRADMLRLAKRAKELNRNVYMIVNNRSEGHAPTTIDAVGAQIVEKLQ